MTLSRKHFKEIVKILNDKKSEIDTNTFEELCNNFADFCRTQNANFKRDIFMQECLK